MRKKRAILIDDEPFILDLLRKFFEDSGYEVITLSEPHACPVYADAGREVCQSRFPCADLIITDMKMPRMSGLELLRQQREMHCKLDIRNKALISGFLSDEEEAQMRDLGCSFFRKPFRLSELVPWITECSQRMDLDTRLQRKDIRSSCTSDVCYSPAGAGENRRGLALNMSVSGICLRLNSPLDRDQEVLLRLGHEDAEKRASVRWIRQVEAGLYEAGLSYC